MYFLHDKLLLKCKKEKLNFQEIKINFAAKAQWFTLDSHDHTSDKECGSVIYGPHRGSANSPHCKVSQGH